MIITWLGHSCFKIQDKTGTDGITIATDPFDKTLGLKMHSFEANIVTVSHDHYDHNNIKAIRGNPIIINCAGEYDIQGVMIEGIESYHDTQQGIERGNNIIFRIEIDNITVVHLGDLGHILDNKQLDKLTNTDILLIPVGGIYTLDAKKAVEVISQIEPRIIIPMHYKLPGLTININEVDKFIKEAGIASHQEERLKINKKDLPQEDMEIILLKPLT